MRLILFSSRRIAFSCHLLFSSNCFCLASRALTKACNLTIFSFSDLVLNIPKLSWKNFLVFLLLSFFLSLLSCFIFSFLSCLALTLRALSSALSLFFSCFFFFLFSFLICFDLAFLAFSKALRLAIFCFSALVLNMPK